jgi:hypothetical protein
LDLTVSQTNPIHILEVLVLQHPFCNDPTSYIQATRFSNKYFARISYFLKIYSLNNNKNSWLYTRLIAEWPTVIPAQNTKTTHSQKHNNTKKAPRNRVVNIVALITFLSIYVLGNFQLSQTVGGIRLSQGKEIHPIS